MERACTELLQRVAAYIEQRDTAADGGVAVRIVVLDALAQVEAAMPLWRQTAGDWRPLIEAVVGWRDVDSTVTPIPAELKMTQELACALRRRERRLFVPALNTEITLAESWTFTLHYEDRNTAVWAAAVGMTKQALEQQYGSWTRWTARSKLPAPMTVTLPAGTTLSVSRIYIRQGATDYDSITFVIRRAPKGSWARKGRFWVKLVDANRIVFTEDPAVVEGSAPPPPNPAAIGPLTPRSGRSW